jgi:hypothetical protein
VARSFQIVEYKVAEANYFLLKLEECTYEMKFFEARNYISAFLSATRSITFVLKASLHDLNGFEIWYKKHEDILKASPLARFFLESRNLSQKVGYYPITGCGSYKDDNGNEGIKYHFSDFIETKNVNIPDMDAYSACAVYFNMLLEIIYDCYQVFGFDIDPDKYYTIENLERMNLSIEDIEEQLGFPKGWTGMGGESIEDRIEAIRKTRSTQGVDHILINRLGKNRFGETFD